MEPESKPKQSLYPKVLDSNPDLTSPFLSSSSFSSSNPSLYPSLDDPNPNPSPSRDPAAPPSSSSSSLYPSVEMKDLVDNLFPDTDEEKDPNNPGEKLPPPVQETLITVPGAILHLIDKQSSVELASGDFFITRITQAGNVVALVAHIDDVQWPLARDEAAVKLDDSHYFFALHDPSDHGLFNYGLTFPLKGQEKLLDQLDGILESCSSFSKEKVNAGDSLGWAVDKEVTAVEAVGEMKEKSAAYWTTLAPNVEEYSSSVAKVIAMGSGRVIQGILWCGDVTVDRLKWGEEYLRRKMDKNEKESEISKEALERIKRVKRVTKMSEKVVTGILSGVVRVSGYFTSSVVNSKVGKKFFSMLPGEVVLASLDGFAKICDAAEMAGKNIMGTSSTVTTGLVSHRYGDQAAEITHEGLSAAGHAIGTAWAVFKIRKALNPKSAFRPATLAKSAAKSAADDLRAKQAKQGNKKESKK